MPGERALRRVAVERRAAEHRARRTGTPWRPTRRCTARRSGRSSARGSPRRRRTAPSAIVALIRPMPHWIADHQPELREEQDHEVARRRSSSSAALNWTSAATAAVSSRPANIQKKAWVRNAPCDLRAARTSTRLGRRPASAGCPSPPPWLLWKRHVDVSLRVAAPGRRAGVAARDSARSAARAKTQTRSARRLRYGMRLVAGHEAVAPERRRPAARRAAGSSAPARARRSSASRPGRRTPSASRCSARARRASRSTPRTIASETRVRPSSRRSQASGLVASSAPTTNSSRWNRRISGGEAADAGRERAAIRA